MTQIFTESGEAVPVTVIEAGPCYVTQVRTAENDGYAAIQIGFDPVEERHAFVARRARSPGSVEGRRETSQA